MRLFYLVCVCFFSSLSSASTYVVGASKLSIQHYKELQLQYSPQQLNQLTDYSHQLLKEPGVLDILLMQQALSSAGLEQAQLQLTAFDSIDQAVQQLQSGQSIVAFANSVELETLIPSWEQLFITIAVFDKDDLHAGLFTDPKRQQVLQSQSLQDIQQLTAMTSSSWTSDWQALTNLGLKHLYDGNWQQQQNALIDGKIDFITRPFSKLLWSIEHSDGRNMTLIPIEGLKIELTSSRHFATAKTHAQGRYFNAALNLGLIKMQNTGRLQQALSSSGFINAKISDWQTLKSNKNTDLGISYH